MKGLTKKLLAFYALLVILFLFLPWYEYSMEVAKTYTINSPNQDKQLLIAAH